MPAEEKMKTNNAAGNFTLMRANAICKDEQFGIQEEVSLQDCNHQINIKAGYNGMSTEEALGEDAIALFDYLESLRWREYT